MIVLLELCFGGLISTGVFFKLYRLGGFIIRVKLKGPQIPPSKEHVTLKQT